MSFAQANAATTAIKLTLSHVAYWSLVQLCRLEAGATHPTLWSQRKNIIPLCSADILAGKSAWFNPVKFHCQPGRI